MKRTISLILVVAIIFGFIAMIGFEVFAETETPVREQSAEGQLKVQEEESSKDEKGNWQPGKVTEPEEAAPEEKALEDHKESGALDGFDEEVIPEPEPDTKAPIGPVEEVEVAIGQAVPYQTIPSKPSVKVITAGLKSEAWWGNPNGAATTHTSFVSGTYYYLTVHLHSDSGFDPYVDVTVYGNGYFSEELSADGKDLYIYSRERCAYKTVSEIGFKHLPKSIKAGAATKPVITLEYGNVELLNVQWVDSNHRAVSTLKSGYVYYLEIAVKGKTGYTFDMDDVDLETEWSVWYHTTQSANDTGVFYIRYSLKKMVSALKIKTNGPKLGLQAGKLKATVSGSATPNGIGAYTWNYEDYMYKVETFKKYDTYEIWWYFKPKSGYEFNRNMKITLNGKTHTDWAWNADSLEVHQVYNTFDPISKVTLTCPTPYVGMPVSQLRLSVPYNANYGIDVQGVYDLSTDTLMTNGYLEEGKDYQIVYSLLPGLKYYFTNNCKAYINGKENPFYLDDIGGYEGFGGVDFTFNVYGVEIGNVPHKIYPGPAVIPNLEVLDDEWEPQVSITKVQWVDVNNNPVTTFREGNKYRLAATLKPVTGRTFSKNVDITVYGMYDETKIINSTQAVVYKDYSLLPEAGRVDVTVSGMRAGIRADQLSVSVSGKAQITYVTVYDGDWNLILPDETLKSNTLYQVYVGLKPLSGYRLTETYCNGEKFYAEAYDPMGEEMEVSTMVSDFIDVSAISMTISGVTVGKDIASIVPVKASGAKFDVDCRWSETSDSAVYPKVMDFGKLKQGHQYNLDLIITPATGYVFKSEQPVYINGVRYDGYSWDGEKIYITLKYSFMTKISRVDLPAMPTKIKKDQALSTNYRVADNKTYSLSATWFYSNGGDYSSVSKASRNGTYELDYSVVPKAGYEFADNVQVYVGGKLVSSGMFSTSNWNITYYKAYNLGMKKITKVELNTAALDPGSAPGVGIPSGAKYTVSNVYWSQSDKNDIGTSYTTSKLEYAKYTWVSLRVEPAAGYVIDPAATFYFNGQAVKPLYNYNAQIFVNLEFYRGLLGITPPTKLPTPKVTVSGNGIKWNAISYATSYEVYRSTSASKGFAKVATLPKTETAYLETSAAGRTYYYKVLAVCESDPTLNSSLSSAAKVNIRCAAPAVSAQNAANGKPQIFWDKVVGAKGYTVYVSTSAAGKYKKLGSTTKLSYIDSKASAGKVYYYKVVANASKSTYSSPYSAVVSCGVKCATPVIKVSTNSYGKPVVSWAKVAGAVKYEIYKNGILLTTTTAISYTDSAMQPGDFATYKVKAICSNTAYNSEMSKEVGITATCATPKITGRVGANKKPVISWGAVDGAYTYIVYRSTKKDKGFVAIGEVGDLSYEDLTAKKGKTYYYKVVAVGEGYKSAASSCVKVKSK